MAGIRQAGLGIGNGMDQRTTRMPSPAGTAS